MLRRLLLAALLLPLFAAAVVLPTAAAADTTYDGASLTKLLLSGSELSNAVGIKLDQIQDEDAKTAPVRVVRDYTDGSSVIVNIGLFSFDDGRMPASSQVDKILSDAFVQASISGYDSTSDFMGLGQPLTGTYLATFNGTTNGLSVGVTALTFVQGNVWGIILYSATQPQDTDSATVGQIYAAQVAKLPK